MYLQTSLGRAASLNLVLISGGPGLYDRLDLAHDQSWGNYVTPPVKFGRERRSFTAGVTEVWWLVYRPAYERRWADDLRRGREKEEEIRRVRSKGFTSYAALLNGRAGELRWHLRWFDSADGLWTLLDTFRDPIARLWYWGHAQDNLWLYLRHAPKGVAIAPPADAVITVDSISTHAGLRSSFVPGGTHCFVGCNTAPFAREWSRVFGVVANGVNGTIDFESIDQTGGVPTLVGKAEWLQYRPLVRQLTP